MLPYILECIAFQLVFLIIYDFFLKRETFFQWNRAYLIGTYSLSLILPWIKIDAFRTAVPETFNGYSELLWNLDQKPVLLNAEVSHGFSLSWQEWIFVSGVLLASVWFILKMYRLYQLKRKGTIQYFKDFTQILVPESYVAFSFFKSIFLGDQLVNKEYDAIISHEMVHIKQRHSLDLLFFELMRIVSWFNPLVYVYQNRIAELHEFIADSKVPKTERAAHYELLLSQVFETQNISFVNQFFKSSLLKKRIVMLQKSKSKKVWQLKYLLLVPLMFGMLAYTSLEAVGNIDVLKQQTDEDADLIAKINKEIEDGVAKLGSLEKVFSRWTDVYNNNSSKEDILTKEMYFRKEILMERLSQMYMDSLKQAQVPFFTGSKSIKKRIPSTARYESYVQYTKAFHILDKNLQYSIQNRFENGGTSIKLLDINSNFSSAMLVLEINDIKDLTGAEVRTFNTRISEIFETKTSKYEGLVITDGEYSFEVFELDLAESETVENLVDEKPKVLSFSKVENVPVFPGCENDADKRGCFFENMRKHISKNFNYPEAAQEKGIQGRVNSMFVIDEKGEITNLKMRGPDSLLTNEAKRIINRLPIMKPGMHKDKVVKVAFSIPISFKLNENGSATSNKQETIDYDGASDVPFAIVDEIPIFPGCEDAENKRACFNEMMQLHISKNFNYPQEAQDKGIQGRVNVIFRIQRDGSIGNLKMRGPDRLLENEVERIIKRLPQMIPGEHEGETVDVPFSIPISFKLSDDFKNTSSISNEDNRYSATGLKMMFDQKEEPIFVLDGIETETSVAVTIDPDTIESVNVLKGKIAKDKYGEKGKYGVVEITTKKKN